MRRRHFLAALGASLPVAGCAGTDPSTAPTSEERTATPPDEGTTTAPSTEGTAATSAPTANPETLALGDSFEAPGGATATVHDVRVRRAVFTLGVHTDPHYRPDEQFVVADVSSSDRDPLSRFAIETDGDRRDAGANDALVSPFGDPTGELLGFRVPAPLEIERGAVVWTGPDGSTAVWPVDSDAVDALAHPPAFEVREFSVPEEVERGSAFDATLTVANDGSGDGEFRAELGATTISDTPELAVEVAAGETVTTNPTIDPYYPEDADELPVVLNWDADRLERTAKITD